MQFTKKMHTFIADIFCLYLIVIGLSFNTDSVDIVLRYTSGNISMAALSRSCAVHCWHRFTHTSRCVG